MQTVACAGSLKTVHAVRPDLMQKREGCPLTCCLPARCQRFCFAATPSSPCLKLLLWRRRLHNPGSKAS